MTSFTKPNLRDLRIELDTALRAVGAKNGINFTLGNIRFTNSDFRCQLTANLPLPLSQSTTGAPAMTAEESKFRQYAAMLGVKPDDYGKVITVGRRRYTLVGCMPQGTHYSFIGQTYGGTGRYKLTKDQVLGSLGVAVNPVVAASSASILNEVNAIVEACNTSSGFLGMQGALADSNTKLRKEESIEQRLAALQRLIGPALQVGKEIRFQVADGYARYIVTEVGATVTKVAHLKLGDAWQSPAVFNGTLRTVQATQLVGRADAFAAIFGSRAN